jgi:hypothetical protein
MLFQASEINTSVCVLNLTGNDFGLGGWLDSLARLEYLRTLDLPESVPFSRYLLQSFRQNTSLTQCQRGITMNVAMFEPGLFRRNRLIQRVRSIERSSYAVSLWPHLLKVLHGFHKEGCTTVYSLTQATHGDWINRDATALIKTCKELEITI